MTLTIVPNNSAPNNSRTSLTAVLAFDAASPIRIYKKPPPIESIIPRKPPNIPFIISPSLKLIMPFGCQDRRIANRNAFAHAVLFRGFFFEYGQNIARRILEPCDGWAVSSFLAAENTIFVGFDIAIIGFESDTPRFKLSD